MKSFKLILIATIAYQAQAKTPTFENCALVISRDDDGRVTTSSKPLSLVSQDAGGTLYAARLANLQAFVVHNAGRLVDPVRLGQASITEDSDVLFAAGIRTDDLNGSGSSAIALSSPSSKPFLAAKPANDADVYRYVLTVNEGRLFSLSLSAEGVSVPANEAEKPNVITTSIECSASGM